MGWWDEDYSACLVLVRYPVIYSIHCWIRDVSILGVVAMTDAGGIFEGGAMKRNGMDYLLMVLVFLIGALIGADAAESDNRRDCDKLGRVVLDGKGFECREVVN